ncbi:acetyl-CoA carboxylase biotin carboxyl carrier protein [Anaerocolumna sp. AGMB13020]|uniref:acetyl-CoA carboxylase biotin carboxyl carrier protein n=1 Tax=Anaerocolumna sp. AGMB13020 TaxID=3081750 RepID=UPI0029543B41|nr:acetyl-CoA carboxylase biotin carboxyl carrier protein [Anaerocolumna sp. AGMB13020]WOO38403.1 acetyl-CoA carboxylase biotin carboxyl carrier protein [Anaerocolumna sp. AGMB13020]
MKQEEILQLIKAVSSSNLTAFRYKDGEVSLELECIQKEAGEVLTKVIHPVKEESTSESEENLLVIKSPMVGTFYTAKSQNSEPYVQVGDKVKKGQAVGIIEAMKLMNEIESEYDGIVDKIVAYNKDMVEYGQPLIYIRPL